MKDKLAGDCEVYPNYFLAAFKCPETSKVVTAEIIGLNSTISEKEKNKLLVCMYKKMTFGFNYLNYDVCVILAALKGLTCKEIYEISKDIIENNKYQWQTLMTYSLFLDENMDYFDIQEPSPGVRTGLKLYGGRMHSHKLQDLPIAPGTMLTSDQIRKTKKYCVNDLDTTIELYNQIKDRIELREKMIPQYGSKILSKSDAQIAELVIIRDINKKKKGKSVKKPTISLDTTFKYICPEFIQFESPELNTVLDFICQYDFELDKKGSVKLPDYLSKNLIELGFSKYKLGIGGIHSTEKRQTIEPTEDQLLVDRDVEAYYPRIILNLQLYPLHLGPTFLNVYRDIVERRIKAKKEKDHVTNSSLKIVINGSFGKLGSKWSYLYSPDLMLRVTITGQLSLLMLIEELEMNGISVVSANTDGFVSLMNKDDYDLYDEICDDWEYRTGFTLEETKYKALYSRDVNNYLAVTEESSKGKGIFTIDQLSKNPQANICVIAVRDLLVKGKPISKTIKGCKDVRQFLNVRTVAGGAVFGDEYLGKVVRWYYSTNGEKITYQKNGNKVPKSDGSMPMMTLTDFPKDVDYERYIQESMTILETLGVTNL